MRILALDTEPSTTSRLRTAGHDVTEASFGYRDGRRALYDAPHEFDAIVFDLLRPACFDVTRWGTYDPNDNFKCEIVPYLQLTWETQHVGLGANAHDRFRYKLIQESQIVGMGRMSPSPFGPNDVRAAVEKAGVPLIMFLNHQWALRIGGVDFPNIFGARWMTERVRSERFKVADPLAALLPAIPAFSPRLPISCKLYQGPRLQGSREWLGSTTTIVSDLIDNSLGEVATIGNGNVWLLPEMTDNGEVCVQLLAALQQGASSVTTSAAPLAAGDADPFDVFISHAHADKTSFADPLAKTLRDRGVRVWYDSYVLKPGDSLSGMIDDGLKRSRHGVLILSPSFFEGRWPESEYRALLALGRRLIPVWHNVEHEQVVNFSPLLADTFAIRGTLGVESAALQIISVVRPDLMGAVVATMAAAPVATAPAPEPAKFEDYDLAPYRVGDEGVPIDALPWQAFAANSQPCLEVRFGEPQSNDVGRGEKRWSMRCNVTNVGAGAARAIRLFLPYLHVINIDTLQPQQDHNGGFYIDDRFAFWYFVKFPAQAVFEYEDISGFLYRQYGTVDQGTTTGGAFFRFSIRAIGKPYRVKARIVKPDIPAAWMCEIPR